MRPSSILVAFAATLAARPALSQTSCPAERNVVELAGSTNPIVQKCERDLLIKSLKKDNTTILLGPAAKYDFTNVNDLPIELGHCVTLTSVDQFSDHPDEPPHPCPTPAAAAAASAAVAPNTRRSRAAEALRHAPGGLPILPQAAAPGRTPSRLGPELSFGQHTGIPDTTAFLQTTCALMPTPTDGNGARISGVRIWGPTPYNQTNDWTGFRNDNCLDVEISNSELAGWGGAAVEIRRPALKGEVRRQGIDDVRILVHDNYIHNNQHSSSGDHSGGYGVNTSKGAYTNIYHNAFDYNAHSVTASGDGGGYYADGNLILKGGGHHDHVFTYIHVFDAHGTDHCNGEGHAAYNCGDTVEFLINNNTFQYVNSDDIGIRGKPRFASSINKNVFARSSERSAIDTYSNDNIFKAPTNRYDVDTYGQYQLCDFDGDGVDDLFLSSGATWWYSSFGQFPWTFLNEPPSAPQSLALGYFDGDQRCDVLIDHPEIKGRWLIASGGGAPFKTFGDFGHPLSEVRFGRFDPNLRDQRTVKNRATTHAFWRRGDGQWFVSKLDHPNWVQVQHSQFELSQLRFGDFEAGGVTDVLAVVDGHWAISSGAAKPWRRLNANLNDSVDGLMIANMDADDDIDDILKLDRRTTVVNGIQQLTELTWWRSKNGTGPWIKWNSFSSVRDAHDGDTVPVYFGYAGRFYPAPQDGSDPRRRGGGTMIIDKSRIGRFFNPAASSAPLGQWESLGAY